LIIIVVHINKKNTQYLYFFILIGWNFKKLIVIKLKGSIIRVSKRFIVK